MNIEIKQFYNWLCKNNVEIDGVTEIKYVCLIIGPKLDFIEYYLCKQVGNKLFFSIEVH